MKATSAALSCACLVLLSLMQTAQATDCFGWSWTKRASYMEMLPQLLYYDKVDWINLDPGRTCTFFSTEAVFLLLINKNLTATYQTYKDTSGRCRLTTDPAKPYINGSWIYSNHILQDSPDVCGFLISIRNPNTVGSAMFEVIRSAASYI